MIQVVVIADSCRLDGLNALGHWGTLLHQFHQLLICRLLTVQKVCGLPHLCGEAARVCRSESLILNAHNIESILSRKDDCFATKFSNLTLVAEEVTQSKFETLMVHVLP